tara:strand:- start:286 stop:471 length:186 start_codon:yes stop_codon:yes gene_type:complete
MSKTKGYAQEFLDNVGYQLGYNEDNMPEFKDIDTVWTYRVPIWEYKGMTEEEYYWGGTNNA